ncbi:MAG: HAD family hydrolase [Dehalococcoidia bacterium]|nr:HAD family hydrolase [Dehalococcoidia bacterium]
MAIRAVIFDLWQTLILDTPEVQQKRRELRTGEIGRTLALAGFPADRAQIEDAFLTNVRACSARRARELDISGEEQVRTFLTHLGAPETLHEGGGFDAVFRAYTEGVVDILPTVLEGTVPALQTLCDAGVRMGLISNTGSAPGPTLRRMLERLELLHYLEPAALTFSDELRRCKPDPAVFHHTLATLSIAAEDAVFVGDTPRLDIAGAHRAGIRSVLVGGKAPGEHVPHATIAHLGQLATALRDIDPEWGG